MCQGVIYLGQWMSLSFDINIERFEIYTALHLPILLWHYHHASIPWGRKLYLGNNTHGFHPVQLIFDFGMQKIVHFCWCAKSKV